MPYAHMKELLDEQKDTGESPYQTELNGHRVICGRCYRKNIHSLIYTPKKDRANYLKEPAYCEIIKGEKACTYCKEKSNEINSKRITKTKAELQNEIDELKRKIEMFKEIIFNGDLLIKKIKREKRIIKYELQAREETIRHMNKYMKTDYVNPHV